MKAVLVSGIILKKETDKNLMILITSLNIPDLNREI